MDDDVVCQLHRKLEHLPVEKKHPVFTARTPPITQISHFDARRHAASFSRKILDASFEPLRSGANIPAAEMVCGIRPDVAAQLKALSVETKRLFLIGNDFQPVTPPQI